MVSVTLAINSSVAICTPGCRDSGSSSPGSSPGWGHCVVLLCSLQPGVQMATDEFIAGGNPAMH